MNDKIINVTFPKCGTCRFWQKPDASGAADCFGMPPTVILLGATKNVLGQPGVQLETFVARTHKDRPGCSLHKPKDDFATAGSS